MHTFASFLRQFIGYVFTLLGGLIALGSLAGFGMAAWLSWDDLPLSSHSRAILWPLGPIFLVLGAGILAAGIYLRRRRVGPVDSAFSRAAGARRQKTAVGNLNGTFVWPLAAALWYAVRDHPAVPATPLAALGGAVFIYAGFQFIIACHELGHLGAAAILGMDLHAIQVGTGPRLFAGRLGGLRIEFRALLGGGIVRASDAEERGWRWRHWLFIAGGPAAHGLACLALGWWLWRHVGAPTHLGWRWLALAWVGDAPAFFALWLLSLTGWTWVFALWPRTVRFDAIQARTDGYWLLHVPRLPQAAVRQHVIVAALQSAQHLWERGERGPAWERVRLVQTRYPGDPTHVLAEGYYLGQEGRHAEAAASIAQSLQRADGAPELPVALRNHLWAERFAALVRAGEPDAARGAAALALEETAAPGDRAEMLDALASKALMPELRPFLPHADEWSREMLALESASLTRQCTRGAILADLGRFDEAEPFLRRVWAESRRDSDAALSAFGLGLIARSRGQEPELRHWRRRAESFATVVYPWFAERIARELQPGATSKPR